MAPGGPVDKIAPEMLALAAAARRAGSIRELAFVMVNRSQAVLPATLVLFWRRRGGRGNGVLTAASGVLAINREAPFVADVEQFLVDRIGGADRPPGTAQRLDPGAADAADAAGATGAGAGAPDGDACAPARLAAQLPPRGLLLPLAVRGGRLLGGLWLLRATAWSQDELAAANDLADMYGHALGALEPADLGAITWRMDRRRLLAGIGLGIALSLVPFEQTVLAPATVIPRDPVVITAPMDGVVERVMVEPNERVVAGRELVRLDATTVRSRHELALRSLAVSQAELLRLQQMSFSDPEAKARLGLLQPMVDQRMVEAAYTEELFRRATVTAPAAGLAMLGDPAAWRGRPVVTGERIMVIADPGRVALEIQLPIGDAITLEEHARVVFFPNGAPLAALEGAVLHQGFEAVLTPEGLLAYRLVATLGEGEAPPRIGIKGTARLHGEAAPLLLHLIRRPMSWLRQAVGW